MPTLEQLDRELKILRDQMNLLRTFNLDLNGRRVVNASPAVNDSDYVTKAELDALEIPDAVIVQRSTPTVPAISTSGVQQVDLFIPHTLAILTNASQQIYLAENFTIGSFIVAVKSAPIGGNVDFILRVNNISVLTGGLTADSLSSGIQSAEAILNKNLPITLDINSVGLTFPGSDLVLSLRATAEGAIV